jgi:hypothetical protein
VARRRAVTCRPPIDRRDEQQRHGGARETGGVRAHRRSATCPDQGMTARPMLLASVPNQIARVGAWNAM